MFNELNLLRGLCYCQSFKKYTCSLIISLSFYSEMDFLKNEHFAIPVVCDSVQPSLDHKDSEDTGQNPVINSSDKEKDEDIHLSKSDEVDSSIPKENFPSSLPRREREEMPSSSPSSKNTVHFDKPNRLVCILCLEVHLSCILFLAKLEELHCLFCRSRV